MKTQSSPKVNVQKELNRALYWIVLFTYTNIIQSVCLFPMVTRYLLYILHKLLHTIYILSS